MNCFSSFRVRRPGRILWAQNLFSYSSELSVLFISAFFDAVPCVQQTDVGSPPYRGFPHFSCDLTLLERFLSPQRDISLSSSPFFVVSLDFRLPRSAIGVSCIKQFLFEPIPLHRSVFFFPGHLFFISRPRYLRSAFSSPIRLSNLRPFFPDAS